MACAACGSKYPKAQMVPASANQVIPAFNPNKKKAVRGVIKNSSNGKK